MNKNICICITEMDSFSKYGWVCVGLMVHGEITLFSVDFSGLRILDFKVIIFYDYHSAEMCVKVHVKSACEKCV